MSLQYNIFNGTCKTSKYNLKCTRKLEFKNKTKQKNKNKNKNKNKTKTKTKQNKRKTTTSKQTNKQT